MKKKLFKAGDKIRFLPFTKSFTVIACNERFLICKCGKISTIVDFKLNLRGTEDININFKYDTINKCMQALNRLNTGKTKISDKNSVYLDISYSKK